MKKRWVGWKLIEGDGCQKQDIVLRLWDLTNIALGDKLVAPFCTRDPLGFGPGDIETG